MRVALIVLLLAVAVMAYNRPWRSWNHGNGVTDDIYNQHEEPSCIFGEDCEKLCESHDLKSVDALCVNGACMCNVEDDTEAKEDKEKDGKKGGKKKGKKGKGKKL